jgi:hypothetical protein
VSRGTRRLERPVEIIDADERQWTEECEPPAPATHGSGLQYIDKTPLSPAASEVEYQEAASSPESPMVTGGLMKQEQYQMLMQSIQLYGDEWKLATIRSDAKSNRLIAYLVPRNKRLDLKTAISKQKVLRIMIDSRGNTDIQEPTRRGPLGLLTAWFRGG